MSRAGALDAATIARAAAPVLLLLTAMGVPWLAGPATLVLAVGAAVGVARKAPVAWAWAAMVPASALATVRAFSGVVPVDVSAVCQAFDSPRFGWAIAEAAVVLGAFTALAIALRTRRASVGMRMPARAAIRLAVVGFGALGLAGLVVVSFIHGGLPGPGGPYPSTASFVLAVLVGAAAIALAEELTFRGVMQHWLARTVGEWPAVLIQAVAYGVWVSAVGWGPIMGVAAGAAGLVAGALTARTNSLLVAFAWHWGVAAALLASMLCP
ncbi:MAG: CPBP family glutamic-type intramembrane protease [Candidatus Limnocylindrales bacterium]